MGLALVLVLSACGYEGGRWFDAWLQRDRLSKMGISPAFFEAQYEANRVSIGSRINDLAWLRSRQLRELDLTTYVGLGLDSLTGSPASPP